LEQDGFSTSQKQQQDGRTRKIYEITQKGNLYLQVYNEILREQLDGRDIN
jgi:DNA-binding PadR family transcriptional regulator